MAIMPPQKKVMDTVHQVWRDLRPHEATGLLAGLRVPWWIAGGWALDLFLEKSTRLHSDLDIGVFRRDIATVIASLAGWAATKSSAGNGGSAYGGGSSIPGT
jgi:hypothetical protein